MDETKAERHGRAPRPGVRARGARAGAVLRALAPGLLLSGLVLVAAGPQEEDEPAATPSGERPSVLVVEIAGVISPATAEYVEAALTRAERQRHDAVLLRVDTPGGMLDPTRRIVQGLLGARVPVIAHVAPAGARAGSAGVFVVMAAHVAVMAPGTNIGAAHPVTAFGGDVEEAGGQVLAEKVLEDTAALLRSIAEQRDRNVDWADRAVRESESVTAREALDLDVVDLLAAGEDEVLAAADGRAVETAGETTRLQTEGAALVDFPMTVRQRTLSALASPDLAYLLVMFGILGLVLELYNPGLVVPAVAGTLCLLLAAIGLDVLPVNAGAVVLLVLAVGFLVAEIAVVSFGLLTVAGMVCLFVGSMLLIDTSDPAFLLDASVRVSWTLVLPSVVLVTGVLGAVLGFMYKVHRRKGTTGTAGMEGARGRARTEVGPEGGTVVVHGESWAAVSERPLAAGDPVRVAGVDGLVLRVEPAEDASSAAGRPHAAT